MNFLSRSMAEESSPSQQDITKCPFLREICKPTNFSFATSAASLPLPVRGTKGPIFEDSPNFDMAFRLFHGQNGVVPLSEHRPQKPKCEAAPQQFNSLAGKAATISLSGFGDTFRFDAFNDWFKNQQRKHKSSKKDSSQVRGSKGPIFEDGPNFDMAFRLYHGPNGVVPLSEHCPQKPKYEVAPQQFNPLAAISSLSGFGGSFGFDAFHDMFKNQQRKHNSSHRDSSQRGDANKHEAMGGEWLQSGNCPIAKSYRAVSNVLPLVAKALKPPSRIKYKCPPAIAAAGAALAQTPFAKNLRHLHAKVLVIGIMGMAANVSLGIWREHSKKFSPSWSAAVPFFDMPKAAMAFTIVAAILGLVIGSRAERYRLKVAAGIPPTNAGSHQAGVNMAGSHQAGVHMDGSHQAGVNMAGSNQARVNMDGSHQAGVNMAGSHQAGVNMDGSHQALVNMAGSHQVGVNMDGSHQAGVNMAGSHQAGVNMDGSHQALVNMAGSHQARVNMDGSHQAGVNMAGSHQAGVNMDGSLPAGVTTGGHCGDAVQRKSTRIQFAVGLSEGWIKMDMKADSSKTRDF